MTPRFTDISKRLVLGEPITERICEDIRLLVKANNRLLQLVEDLSAELAHEDVLESDPEPEWSET